MSLKPEYVINWSWLTAEEIADLPIDWQKLTDDECTALSQLIMIIETMIYEKNNSTH